MCLLIFAHECHPRYRLVLAANRDEFYARPTAPAAFWDDVPHLLAGKDLQGGGTWLGITRGGRLAALTNYRDPATLRHDTPSRGGLVSAYLEGKMPAADYLALLRREGARYNGFNLLFGSVDRLFTHSNLAELPPLVPPCLHGISNHLVDTPWPKVVRGKELLARLLAADEELDPETLLALLADRDVPPDSFLPDTGVGLDRERQLAPIFIATPDYGTRSSTVILVDRKGEVRFVERSFAPGSPPATVAHRFRIAD